MSMPAKPKVCIPTPLMARVSCVTPRLVKLPESETSELVVSVTALETIRL